MEVREMLLAQSKNIRARRLLLLAIWAVWSLPASIEAGDEVRLPKDGQYVGLEPMTNLTPEDSSARWFHENRLFVRNGEAILDKVPVVIQHGKKGYSASDGGFFTYRARFALKDGQTTVALRLCQTDYVIFPKDKHDQYEEIKTYTVRLTPGRIEFNNVKYSLGSLRKYDIDRFEKLLKTEPLEKAATNPN